MGTSPVRYLNDYRLSVARELLLHTGKSIKSVAAAVGIPDPFYFSRLFRTAYGQSPQTCRNMAYSDIRQNKRQTNFRLKLTGGKRLPVFPVK